MQLVMEANKLFIRDLIFRQLFHKFKGAIAQSIKFNQYTYSPKYTLIGIKRRYKVTNCRVLPKNLCYSNFIALACLCLFMHYYSIEMFLSAKTYNLRWGLPMTLLCKIICVTLVIRAKSSAPNKKQL